MNTQTLPTPFVARSIKSFVRRNGRTTVAQTRAMEELGPKFTVPYTLNALDFVATYADRTGVRGQNDAQRTILEIGFGMGEATAHIAALMPDTWFLCCDVHPPGVGALLNRIVAHHLSNIRICAHDAVEVIDQMLPVQSLDGVHVFFPDPWHKARHHKRRLIQAPFVAQLATRLKAGGYIHCATDWQPYAEQMLQVFSLEPLLTNSAAKQHPKLLGYAPKPDYRPLTKFESRGIKQGHGVWDVVFKRV